MRNGFYSFILLIALLPVGATFAYGLPSQIQPPGEKLIVVDPVTHAWGAYDSGGHLVRSGLASLGANYCKDMHMQCHTQTGLFRIRTLGSPSCSSPSFPIPKGGSPMPYCMYFNDVQAIHGSYHVVNGNISHGCVRLHVDDAKWLRYHFAEIGTLVFVKSY